ncbi:MAG: LysR family transcriptional regulator [Archangium sp.]
MELRHLRTFVALSDTLHFGRAAAKLGLGQPAVSQMLKDLETELGVTLIERTRRAAELTPAGHQFLLHARRGLEAVEDATQGAQRAGEGALGSVVLGLNALTSLSALPNALAKFRAKYPLVRVRLIAGGTTQLVEQLRAGQCDVAFTITPGEVSPLASEAITHEPLYAMFPSKHRLANRARVRFPDFLGEPMIHRSRLEEPNLHREFIAACEREGVTPNIFLETGQIETVFAFVAAGMAFSLVPATVRRMTYPGVKLVEVTPRIDAGVTMVWNPARLPVTAQRLLEFLRAEKLRSSK